MIASLASFSFIRREVVHRLLKQNISVSRILRGLLISLCSVALLSGCRLHSLVANSVSQAASVAPASKYWPNTRCPTDNGDGTRTDPKTGLIWQACALGQTWDNSQCSGDPSLYFWEEALMVAKNNQFQGKGDWILPTYNQLKELSDWDCGHGPRIQQWTSTRDNKPKRASSNIVTYHYFETQSSSFSEKLAVRLVRGSQSKDINEFKKSLAEIEAKPASVKPSNRKGEYSWPDGTRYEGDWKNGKMHGSGTYFSRSGNRYEGQFNDGMFNGFGTYTWKKGSRYSGKWKNDEKDGEGIYCDEYGDCERRVYENGKFVRKIYDKPITSSSRSGAFNMHPNQPERHGYYSTWNASCVGGGWAYVIIEDDSPNIFCWGSSQDSGSGCAVGIGVEAAIAKGCRGERGE